MVLDLLTNASTVNADASLKFAAVSVVLHTMGCLNCNSASRGLLLTRPAGIETSITIHFRQEERSQACIRESDFKVCFEKCDQRKHGEFELVRAKKSIPMNIPTVNGLREVVEEGLAALAELDARGDARGQASHLLGYCENSYARTGQLRGISVFFTRFALVAPVMRAGGCGVVRVIENALHPSNADAIARFCTCRSYLLIRI